MAKIPMLRPLVPRSDGRTIQPPPSQGTVDPVYHSERYKQWREQVISGAGKRCEVFEAGKRCSKAAPGHRMFADHKVELRDGGAPFDLSNGQCLCGSHHTRKTAQARAQRMGR
jgi:5-methylcytosine-specific restriction protein A